MSILNARWKCCECGELHDDEVDAQDCCPPEVREVYVCPICTDDYLDEHQAIDCCGFDPNNPDALPPPSTAELEAAGQLRLLP